MRINYFTALIPYSGSWVLSAYALKLYPTISYLTRERCQRFWKPSLKLTRTNLLIQQQSDPFRVPENKKRLEVKVKPYSNPNLNAMQLLNCIFENNLLGWRIKQKAYHHDECNLTQLETFCMPFLKRFAFGLTIKNIFWENVILQVNALNAH